MDKNCYKQLANDKSARVQLWFEISSEINSHKLWRPLDDKSKKIVEEIIRDVIVEGWND